MISKVRRAISCQKQGSSEPQQKHSRPKLSCGKYMDSSGLTPRNVCKQSLSSKNSQREFLPKKNKRKPQVYLSDTDPSTCNMCIACEACVGTLNPRGGGGGYSQVQRTVRPSASSYYPVRRDWEKVTKLRRGGGREDFAKRKTALSLRKISLPPPLRNFVSLFPSPFK